MSPKFWLDLFTGKTWEEFLQHGANVTGFRETRKKISENIKPGDYFLCYLTGISRFVGVLEVKSPMYIDHAPIWSGEDFPVRFKVELIHQLNPETAVPVMNMKDKLSFFKDMKSTNSWTGFFRGSPAEFNLKDAEIILEEIKKAFRNPVKIEFDPKKYWCGAKIYNTKVGNVTVPEREKEELEPKETKADKTTHEEIQGLLLKLGSDLGLDVWVARNDRNKEFNGIAFQNIPNLRKSLPRQFDEATNRTIELIDVLWLQGDAIIGAFEVEHTSAIYSGLLRMADLISMQPNIKINLFIVAPDERRDKVFEEINRPTFARLKPPLPKICKFIPYSELKREIERIGNRVKYLKPEFLEEIAESCEAEEL
jgi:hypothetical protein